MKYKYNQKQGIYPLTREDIYTLFYYFQIMKEIDPIYHKNFCQRLKKLRKEKKLTQERISDIIEMDQSTYRAIENGQKSNPTFKTLVNLSIALDVSLKNLLDISNN